MPEEMSEWATKPYSISLIPHIRQNQSSKNASGGHSAWSGGRRWLRKREQNLLRQRSQKLQVAYGDPLESRLDITAVFRDGINTNQPVFGIRTREMVTP